MESKQISLIPESSLQKVRTGKKKKKEESIQIFIARHMRIRYPDVIFNSDIASGMRLTIGQAVKAKAMRSSRAQPDIIILEPRGKFNGLCIEIKKGIYDVYLKDGVTISNAKSSKHVREQNDMLIRLREKGYFAEFGFGISGCIKIIDEYMAL